jgi:hypothetical protein
MIVANPRPLPSASNRSRPLPPRKCHPERSEGSAFRFSSLCALCISAFSSPNVDALDAASSISPLSVTLTKNTRGGGGGTSQASAKNTNPDPSLFDFRLLGLFTLRSEGGVVEGSSFNSSSSNSFTIRTYPKPARNPFAMSTSKTKDLKSFRIRTYEKNPGGGGSHPFNFPASPAHRVNDFSTPTSYPSRTTNYSRHAERQHALPAGSSLPDRDAKRADGDHWDPGRAGSAGEMEQQYLPQTAQPRAPEPRRRVVWGAWIGPPPPQGKGTAPIPSLFGHTPAPHEDATARPGKHTSQAPSLAITTSGGSPQQPGRSKL